MKAIILAAGRGERLRPHTDHTPKPLLKAGRHRLIEYHLTALVRSGITDIVINLAHLGSRIEDFVGDGARYGAAVQYSREGDTGLETGGGIFNALPLLGPGPFIAVNGDIWTDYPFTQLPQRLGDDLCHLVLTDNPAHHPAGDFGLVDGRIRNSAETTLTFTGIGVYRAELFATCRPGRFPLAPLLRAAADRDRAGGKYHAGLWLDIGTPERLAALNERLRATQ